MEWKTIWSYLPLNYGVKIGTIKNTVQKTTFWNNVSGSKIKVKFSNRFGQSLLKMKEVTIGLKKSDSDDFLKTVHLTLGGKVEINLKPGEVCYSDEVFLECNAGDEIVLRVWFEEEIDVYESCCTWSKKSWKTSFFQDLESDGKNSEIPCHTQFPFIGEYMSQADVVIGISEIRVFTEDEVRVITLFGDSITHMSYYSDALAQRLYDSFKGSVTLLNKGIGGNKLLSGATVIDEIPGRGNCSGKSGVSRFETDVFETEIPNDVFILIGVNDLMHPYLKNDLSTLPEVEEFISAYKKLISISRMKGSRVFLSTLMPLKHELTPFGPEGEKLRKKINDWILCQKLSDGVFDFSRVSSKDSERMKDEYHIGDGLHPNSEGGIAMAQEVLIRGGFNCGISKN